MARIENFIGKYPRLVQNIDSLLPEKVKKLLRRTILHEEFPLEEPVTVEINGLKASYWINNPSDWYRIARGGFEGDFVIDLLNTVRTDDIFLDVGSAQGFYSILAAKAGARVYAIDPDPISVTSIVNNIELNPEIKEKITVLDMALGLQDESQMLHVDYSGTYAPSLVKTVRGLNKNMPVVVRSLDSLIYEKKIIPPNIMKIDVEGAEANVLNGMSTLLNTALKPRHIFLELHPYFLPYFGYSSSDVMKQIAGFGYVSDVQISNHREKELYHFVDGG